MNKKITLSVPTINALNILKARNTIMSYSRGWGKTTTLQSNFINIIKSVQCKPINTSTILK